MKRFLTTAAVLIALAGAATAQLAGGTTTQAGEQLVYRTQMIRDRIGVLCQQLSLGHRKDQRGQTRDECEGSTYASYYSIVDSIRKAERISGDEALKLISTKIDEFEAMVAPLMRDLERR